MNMYKGQPRLNPCSNGRYSRSVSTAVSGKDAPSVLILVLMEDTLGVIYGVLYIKSNPVLILVLMEDTLGELGA